MPERGAPIGDPVNTAGHLATPQWQSFEMRMRHRRADRCLRRAADAVDAGRLDEASEALEEVRGLDPLNPELQVLSERVTALQAPPGAAAPVTALQAPMAAAALQASIAVVEPVTALQKPPAAVEPSSALQAPPPVVDSSAILQTPPPVGEPIQALQDTFDVVEPVGTLDVVEPAAALQGPDAVLEPIAAPRESHAVPELVVSPHAVVEPLISDQEAHDVAEPVASPQETHAVDEPIASRREPDAVVEPVAALQSPHAIVPEVSYSPTVTSSGRSSLPELEDLDLIDPFTPPELFEVTTPRLFEAPAESRSTPAVMAVACLALALSALVGWAAITHWPTIERLSATVANIAQPAVKREPAPSPVFPESTAHDQAPVPGISATPVEPRPEEQPASEPNATPDPEIARGPVSPLPPAIVPPAVASTTGTLPAPAVQPPPAQAIPQPASEEAQRPSQPASEDPPRPLSQPAVDDPPRASVPPASAGVGTPPPPSVAAPVEPNRPAAVESARPSPLTLDEHVAVRATLARYAAAFSDLDKAAAHAVWPGVDQRALGRAFDGLASQRVTLGTCEVGVNGQTSRAICTGSATWTPKVGGGRQTKARVWTFDLRRADSGWQIVTVDTR